MDVGLVFLEVGTVVIVLAVVSRVSRRLSLTPVPFYVLAGLALGEGGLLPLDLSGEFLEISAELGVVLLLLLLGMEYSGDELLRGLRSARRAAAVDALLNLGAGTAVGFGMGLTPAGALAVGGITYASSSGIVVKLSRDLGWRRGPEMPGVIALLMAEDLAMAVYLPTLAALLVGRATGGTGVALAGAVLAAAGAVYLATRFGDRISALIYSENTESLLLGALGVTLVVAGLAERLQVSAAVGAFVVGIALSGKASQESRPILRPLRDLFAALFFTVFAIGLDPAAIPAVLPLAVGLAVLTGVTKAATAWTLVRNGGLGPGAWRRASSLLVARGEFSLIVAELAVASGLDERIGPLAATYVLVLAVAGPVAARFAPAPPAEPVPPH